MIELTNTYLEKITGAFTNADQGQVLFCNEPVAIDPTHYQGDSRQALRQAIVNTLYLHTHCQNFGKNTSDPAGTPSNDSGELTPMLSKANRCVSRWDKGWRVEQFLGNGALKATRGNESCDVSTGEFVLEDVYSGGLSIGSKIHLFRPHESASLQQGVYFTFSTSQSLAMSKQVQLLRFYFNVKLSGAATMVEHFTQLFERFQVPFRFKIMAQSSFFYRVDTAVLYVPAEFFDISLALINDLLPVLSPHLDDDVCQFTKPIAPGISFAEDPADGQSFGMSRCGVVADAILAILSREHTPEERLATAHAAFAHHGIQLDKPYLNAGSVDCYKTHIHSHREVA